MVSVEIYLEWRKWHKFCFTLKAVKSSNIDKKCSSISRRILEKKTFQNRNWFDHRTLKYFYHVRVIKTLKCICFFLSDQLHFNKAHWDAVEPIKNIFLEQNIIFSEGFLEINFIGFNYSDMNCYKILLLSNDVNRIALLFNVFMISYLIYYEQNLKIKLLTVATK